MFSLNAKALDNWSILSVAPDTLNALWFTNSTIGYGVGVHGIIVKTIDGGNTWSTQISGTTVGLTSVGFTDANNGWAGGPKVLLKTSNGGSTWTSSAAKGTPLASANANTFISNAGSIGYSIDNTSYFINDTIYKTTNTGTAWSSSSISSTTILNSIYLVDANQGWAVGGINFVFYRNVFKTTVKNIAILKTTDGGSSWFGQSPGEANQVLRSVYFADLNNGWAVGDSGIIVKTIDGGTTWVRKTSGTLANLVSVHFATTTTGRVVGDSGIILKTTDGGSTWVKQFNPLGNAKMYSVRFVDTDNGWAVSGKNIIKCTKSTPIVVTSPIGGEKWYAGSSHNITWQSEGVQNVKLEYSFNNGVNWTLISASAASGGIYPWVIPNTPSLQTLIRISDVANSAISDTSDAGFTIPSLTLTSPIGGEIWSVGSAHNITWSNIGVTNVGLGYSINGGSSWATIISSTAASTGSYAWTIPNAPSTQVKIRVRDASNTALSDSTHGFFTIPVPPPSVTLINPNGGQTWLGNSVNSITWSSLSVVNVKLEYSLDNASTWNTITASIAASPASYAWTVPNTPSTLAKVRVSDIANAATSSMSSNVFTISYLAPSLTLTSPNGGETWAPNSTHNVTWSATSVANVKLEYSIDNGTTWATIISSTPSTGTYAWVLPGTLSLQAFVRISDASNPALTDRSNATFNISNTVPIVSTSFSKNACMTFSGNALLHLQLPPSKSWVTLKVFDLKGNLISTLMNEKPSADSYDVPFPNLKKEEILILDLQVGEVHQTLIMPPN